LRSWPSESRPIVLAISITRPGRFSIAPMPTSQVWRTPILHCWRQAFDRWHASHRRRDQLVCQQAPPD
jgi:hypothetical protein